MFSILGTTISVIVVFPVVTGGGMIILLSKP
jgi:hypothetical protein